MTRIPFSLAVLALAAAALPAQAQDAQRVARDLTTGQLRAITAEEGAALSAATLSATALRAPVETTLAKYSRRGGSGLRLTSEFLSHSTVQRAADGRLIEQCVTGPEAAAEVLKAPLVANRTAAAKLETE